MQWLLSRRVCRSEAQVFSIRSFSSSSSELLECSREGFVSLLKECCRIKGVSQGRRLQLQIAEAGFGQDGLLGALLIQLYGSCGCLKEAEILFRSLQSRSVFACNMMISAYTHSGELLEAQSLFDCMSERNVFSWNIMINAFGRIGELGSAKHFFERMCHWTVISVNVMLTAHSQKGDSRGLIKLFNAAPVKNVVSWNTVLYCHLENGDLDSARIIFSRLCSWDVVSCTTMLAAFAEIGDVERAQAMFDQMPEPNVVSWNALIQAYAVGGDLDRSKRLFDEVPSRSIVSWNGMLQASVDLGEFKQLGSDLFHRMPERNLVSWNSFLQGSAAQSSGRSREDHLEELKVIFDAVPVKDVVTCTVMVAACARAGSLEEGKSFFDGMSMWSGRNLICWNCMLQAFAESSDHRSEAELMFDKMPAHDSFSWNTMISVAEADLERSKLLFLIMPQRSLVSWNALAFVYAQNCELREAKRLFDRMPMRSSVSWNGLMTGYIANFQIDCARFVFDSLPEKQLPQWSAMILAYAQNGEARAAIRLFSLMDLEGEDPEIETFATVLDSCSVVSALREGRIIADHLVLSGLVVGDVGLGSAIVNMFGKCGCLEDAKNSFDAMEIHNLVTWNTMIAVFAQNGATDACLATFDLMKLEGVDPDAVSYLTLLSACSHAGRIADAIGFFVSCGEDYGVERTVWQYGCIIDLLGRSGQLGSAEDLIANMPFADEGVVWQAFLSSCRSHGDSPRGLRAAATVATLDPQCSAPYVMLANIHVEILST